MEERNTVATLPAAAPQQLAAVPVETVQELKGIMRSMAEMLRVTHERMASLEHEVKMLTKVTPAQATAINTAIRDRAAELCSAYRARGCEKAIGNAIRRAVKLTTGVNAVRELPRCEYTLAMEAVQVWDDYKAIKAIKEREASKK